MSEAGPVATLRASLVLTSSYVASASVPRHPSARSGTVACTYTPGSGSTNGAPSIVVEGSRDGTHFYPLGVPATTISVSAPVGSRVLYQAALAFSPPGGTDPAYFSFPVALDGFSEVRVRCVETGDTSHLGTLEVLLFPEVTQ